MNRRQDRAANKSQIKYKIFVVSIQIIVSIRYTWRGSVSLESISLLFRRGKLSSSLSSHWKHYTMWLWNLDGLEFEISWQLWKNPALSAQVNIRMCKIVKLFHPINIHNSCIHSRSFNAMIAFPLLYYICAFKGRNILRIGGTNCIYKVATKLENSGKIKKFYFQSGKVKGKRKIFLKVRENQGSYRATIVSFQRGHFLYTQSHIQLIVTNAKFSPFL